MRRFVLLIPALILMFGLSAASEQAIKVKPNRFSGTGLPMLSQFSKTSNDPAKDQKSDHLDIVADYFTFSGSKFYAAIRNRGGGFPFGGALGFPPYYSYMYMIANPASNPKDPGTIVWALNYMKVIPGGIKPGLYKIKGKGADDLIRLGEIKTSIDKANNALLMSCDLAPLLADPDFMSWFNPANPVIGTGSLTNSTTMKGFNPVTVVTDTTPGAWVYLK